MEKEKKIINGIYCEAENCTYHTTDNKCNAGSIQVSSCGFLKCEPDCATFKEKKQS